VAACRSPNAQAALQAEQDRLDALRKEQEEEERQAALLSKKMPVKPR
jgi:cell division protein FtsB